MLEPEPLEERIIEATLRCVARWGIAKTTLDDVAREAKCARATIYRAFPGGKQSLLTATLQHELQRAVSTIDEAVRDLESLEDVLVVGTLSAARLILGHEALQFLIAHEPIAFDKMGRVFDAAAACAAPHLARFLPSDDAARAADWMTRVVLTYTFNPAPSTDLRDEVDARQLVRTFFLPVLSPHAVPTSGSER
jgi:AcrR family transcriptional regulator